MDWSLCKPYARYPLLRPELLYKSQVPVCLIVLSLHPTDEYPSYITWPWYVRATHPLISDSSSLSQLANLCIRFVWLIYVFFHEGNYELWAFVAAMMEMLRRVQWNFCAVIFPLPRDHLGVRRFQIDSRTSILIIWICTASHANLPCPIPLTCVQTRERGTSHSCSRGNGSSV